MKLSSDLKNKDLSEKTKELDGQVKKLKRRISQRDHLNSSMRGLKEMAEERNHNWEVALRLLSGKVLGLDTDNQSKLEGPIGELVSNALNTFGKEIMPENISDAAQQNLEQGDQA